MHGYGTLYDHDGAVIWEVFFFPQSFPPSFSPLLLFNLFLFPRSLFPALSHDITVATTSLWDHECAMSRRLPRQGVTHTHTRHSTLVIPRGCHGRRHDIAHWSFVCRSHNDVVGHDMTSLWLRHTDHECAMSCRLPRHPRDITSVLCRVVTPCRGRRHYIAHSSSVCRSHKDVKSYPTTSLWLRHTDHECAIIWDIFVQDFFPVYEWVMSHTWINHATHLNDVCMAMALYMFIRRFFFKQVFFLLPFSSNPPSFSPTTSLWLQHSKWWRGRINVGGFFFPWFIFPYVSESCHISRRVVSRMYVCHAAGDLYD